MIASTFVVAVIVVQISKFRKKKEKKKKQKKKMVRFGFLQTSSIILKVFLVHPVFFCLPNCKIFKIFKCICEKMKTDDGKTFCIKGLVVIKVKKMAVFYVFKYSKLKKNNRPPVFF